MQAKLNGLAGGLWRYLREATGDDAYERYVAHHRIAHAGEMPLTRAQYYAKRQQEKWSGVARCC